MFAVGIDVSYPLVVTCGTDQRVNVWRVGRSGTHLRLSFLSGAVTTVSDLSGVVIAQCDPNTLASKTTTLSVVAVGMGEESLTLQIPDCGV